ncbi:hypothetical protein KAU11_06450 [Candidatus Babeliales bacterium]|nr:hypothetical protein [Candidatus Babeliales bacterium]
MKQRKLKASKAPRRKMHIAGSIITMRDIEAANPNSVFKSIIIRGNWIGRLHISKQAKRLTYLRDKYFINAVNEIIEAI